MRTLSWILAVLLFAFPAAAGAVTMEEAVEYAEQYADDARIARETATEIEARGRQTTAFIWPQVNASASYLEIGDNREENRMFPFLNTPERDISAEIAGSQVLFAGMRIWNSLDLKDNLYEQADFTVKTGVRDVRGNVRQAFDEVLLERANVKILEDRVEQRRAELKDANDLWEAGVATPLDARQANLNLNFSLDALTSGQVSYEEALIDLNTVMGVPPGNELLVPEGRLEDHPDMDLLLDKLRDALARDDLLDLNSTRIRKAGARLEQDIAKGGYYPEVAFVSQAESSGPEFDEMDESWAVGIQMNWAIFEGWLTRAKTAAAAARVRQIEHGYRKTRRDLSGRIESFEVNLKALRKRIELQKEAVSLSRENYEDARGQYRAGTITLTRLGDFSLAYAEARFNLARLYYIQRRLARGMESLLNA
ncbi:MAG: TolC family protein [Desulfatibacillaceae bacterium]